MRSFKQFLLEMPKHYPGDIVYQKDTKFTPISIRNIQDYKLLYEDGEFVYLVDPSNTTGFVFDVNDLRGKSQDILPAMRVSLRDSGIKNYKQAFFLRIREAYSKKNITSTWYNSYVKMFGGIVSDNEHLEGGKALWKSFIKQSFTDKSKKVYLIDKDTGSPMTIPIDWNDEMIWSKDDSKKNLVIVYEMNV